MITLPDPNDPLDLPDQYFETAVSYTFDQWEGKHAHYIVPDMIHYRQDRDLVEDNPWTENQLLITFQSLNAMSNEAVVIALVASLKFVPPLEHLSPRKFKE